jgi:hypothetical protein
MDNSKLGEKLLTFSYYLSLICLLKFLEQKGRIIEHEIANLLSDSNLTKLDLVDVRVADLFGYPRNFLMVLAGNNQLNRTILIENAANFMEVYITVQLLNKEVVTL